MAAVKSHLSFEALSSEEAPVRARRFRIDYGFHPTPLGRVLLGQTGGRICYMGFVGDSTDRQMREDLAARWPGAERCRDEQLTAETVRRVFSMAEGVGCELALLVCGTRFQVEVWQALQDIPQGEARTYSDIATAVGRPNATRAVGSAIGANPIAWLIPCHRVIRSDGTLGGYRWGLAQKKACLNFDRRGGGVSCSRAQR